MHTVGLVSTYEQFYLLIKRAETGATYQRPDSQVELHAPSADTALPKGKILMSFQLISIRLLVDSHGACPTTKLHASSTR